MTEKTSARSLSPTITLRKGTTEIEVKNAAAIIRRINEMYPNTSEYAWRGSCSPKTERAAQHEKQKLWVEWAKNWFKQEMFGGVGDFELVVKDPTEKETAETQFSERYDEAARKSDVAINERIVDEYEREERKDVLTDSSRNQVPIKAVNKNAYEIRSDILGQALDWVKFKKSCSDTGPIGDEEVLSTAKKFYQFVENRGDNMTDTEFLKGLVAKDDITMEEFNKFVQSNMVRNNFLPVMEHLCKLVKGFDIHEFADKATEETTCVQFNIKNGVNDEYGIDGRVGYDTYEYPAKKIMSYELWWGGECYCHLYRPIEMMNMLSVLLGRAKTESINTYKEVRKSDTLFPIIEK